MSDKVNLEVNGREATVYYFVADGPPANCHYCGKPGCEQLIAIEEVVISGVSASNGTREYNEAKEKVQRGLLHRRGLCERDAGFCEMKLGCDQDPNEELTF